MIYQVLSRPRTGSNKIYQYARYYSKGVYKWLSEYFNAYDSPEVHEAVSYTHLRAHET